MALTLTRWVTIFVLACAAIVIWQAPARSGGRPIDENPYYFGQQFGWPDAGTRLARANLRLRVLELRDSSMGLPVVRVARPGLTILTDGMIPDTIQRSVRSALTAAWARYQAGTRYPVVVAVVTDTSRQNGGLPMATTGWAEAYTFPPDSTNRACRVVMRVAYPLWRADSARPHSLRNQVVRVLTLQSTERAVLGPCALYATFGQPGGTVSGWLASTAWLAVADVDWSRPSPIVQNDLNWADAGPSNLLAVVTGGYDYFWITRNFLSKDAVACIAGRTDRCATALQSNVDMSKDQRAWDADVIDSRTLNGYTRWYWWGRGGNFGPAESWVVSDMVRELGRERFEAFWTSAAPPNLAFMRAAGEPLGTWLERWAHREYGRDELGPWMPEWARWAGLLLMAAGLGVAMLFARERRVA